MVVLWSKLGPFILFSYMDHYHSFELFMHDRILLMVSAYKGDPRLVKVAKGYIGNETAPDKSFHWAFPYMTL